MAKHGTSIEWTHGAGRKGETWNPATGCSKVSPGCAHCYAETVTNLRAGRPGYIDEHRPWTPANAAHNVRLWPERLEKPLHWKKPRMVFVNSMSDLFHEEIPDEYIAQVYEVMADTPQHIYQVLTKRPERMRDFHRHYSLPGWRRPYEIPNLWVGTSIENRRFVDRADVLRETPATVRFISAEPLLGPLVGNEMTEAEWERTLEAMPLDAGLPVLGESMADYETRTRREWAPNLDLTGIDWLIVGGESGPGHRPMNLEWVRDLRDACPYWTAFFFKQVGGATPKAGGRELDGRTWDEMPAVGS